MAVSIERGSPRRGERLLSPAETERMNRTVRSPSAVASTAVIARQRRQPCDLQVWSQPTRPTVPNAQGHSFASSTSAQLVFDDSPHHASGLQLRLNPGKRKRFVGFAGFE